ncbi:hypothetical protein PR003_g26835 [Phytophthora rubi]|uniref:Uncharacterized protein n=1 Tax=Phytophthora rubi TaxID=129364 RepID=A0A6A3IHR3_9STRA|nr:hypothetical protein PR002_g24244 [Phytophthora rubi]KAE8981541.1 hypothetical protein PR001_g23974 [Phytophthora rubi]KAE9284515.1 hypothetical protein PR003_g26835 [Phytophthora rubi]
MSDGNNLATRLEEIEISQSFRARSPDLFAEQGEVSLKDVLRNNGEEHLYDDILKLAVHVDEDPPLIFGWKFVQEFVGAITLPTTKLLMEAPLFLRVRSRSQIQ